MLERRVDFGRIETQPEGSHPVLLVGAVDVLSGQFKAFHSRRDRISAETVLASAAIPTLFRPVRLDGGTYWDGLFSQNPPVKELTDERPNEIWVIQINPRENEREPKTIAEIADRRNELAGNLSLYQELDFIEKIDQMLEQGHLPRDGEYRQIVVRVIELSRSRLSRSLGTASKLNRDPHFIQDLISHGELRAEEFLAALAFEEAWKSRDPDAVMAFFAGHATLTSSSPFPESGRYSGRPGIRAFVTEHLARDVRVDLTKKQIAQNGVTWKVRTPVGDGSGNRVSGVAEAVFRGRDRIPAPGRRNVTGVSLEDDKEPVPQEYFFVSDLHIGGDEQLKILDFEEEFVEFLKSLETRENDTELVIIGDAFGLWEFTTAEGVVKFDLLVGDHAQLFE